MPAEIHLVHQHIDHRVHFLLSEKEQAYPGFIVRLENNRFIIAQSDQPKKIPIGSELLSCDGVPVREIMLQNVFPIRGGIPTLEASWYTKTPYLLQGALPTWKTPFKNCLIRNNNQASKITLNYASISELALQERLLHFFGGPASFSLSYPNKHMTWIRLPAFYTQNDIELHALLQLMRHAQALRNQQFVVFDLRGNGGGDSHWGTELLSTIYGKPVIDFLQQNMSKNTYVEWRASESTLNFLRHELLPYLQKNHGTQSESYTSMIPLIEGMEEAIKNKKPYVTEDGERHKAVHLTHPSSNTIPIFITDGFCTSACPY